MKVILYTLSDAITLIVAFFSWVFPRVQSFTLLLFAIYVLWLLQFYMQVTPKSVFMHTPPTEHLSLEFSQTPVPSFIFLPPVPSFIFLLSVKSIIVHLSSKARIMFLYVSNRTATKNPQFNISQIRP